MSLTNAHEYQPGPTMFWNHPGTLITNITSKRPAPHHRIRISMIRYAPGCAPGRSGDYTSQSHASRTVDAWQQSSRKRPSHKRPSRKRSSRVQAAKADVMRVQQCQVASVMRIDPGEGRGPIISHHETAQGS